MVNEPIFRKPILLNSYWRRQTNVVSLYTERVSGRQRAASPPIDSDYLKGNRRDEVVYFYCLVI